jgi:hypothetical protein
VLQEARIFHDPNLDTRRCSQVWAGGGCTRRWRWRGVLIHQCGCGHHRKHQCTSTLATHTPPAPRRGCAQVITKLLYLLHQGETFTKARLCCCWLRGVVLWVWGCNIHGIGSTLSQQQQQRTVNAQVVLSTLCVCTSCPALARAEGSV